MADSDPHDIPDLDLPPPRASTPNVSVPPVRSGPGAAATSAAPGSFGGDFGMDLDRGGASNPPASMSRAPVGQASSMGRISAAQQVSIDIAGGSDDFDMEIERGGAMTQAPASSGRPSGNIATRAAPAPALAAGSGLDVAYRRMAPRPVVDEGPSLAVKIAARAIPIVLLLGTIALLVKFVHRTGGRNVMKLLPHAFDASSTVQSGAFALTALVLAIAIGFIGLKSNPRSYGMAGSAVALVLASLAMVTVTLVSTEENPTPPDGALLIPYVLPMGIFLLGLGIAGRARSLFLDGGARRAGAFLAGIAGGAVVFIAIELSALAARLP